MFVPNNRRLQMSMFGSINSLPEKILKRLEASWARTFYHQVFVRIDKDRFMVLYSDAPSRPNTPVNVLVGLEILKSRFQRLSRLTRGILAWEGDNRQVGIGPLRKSILKRLKAGSGRALLSGLKPLVQPTQRFVYLVRASDRTCSSASRLRRQALHTTQEAAAPTAPKRISSASTSPRVK